MVNRNLCPMVNRNLLLYVVVVLIFSVGIYFVLASGSRLESGRIVPAGPREHSTSIASSPQQQISEPTLGKIGRILRENLREPLSILLLQITVILIAARLIGRLFRKIGQPSVIGEMVAGILLGPSLLGLASPGTLSFLFPASSMGALRLLSQIGVILFMFTVGMELNAQRLREKARAAVMISHAGIVVPFFLGVSVSLLIYRS